MFDTRQMIAAAIGADCHYPSVDDLPLVRKQILAGDSLRPQDKAARADGQYFGAEDSLWRVLSVLWQGHAGRAP